MKAEELVKVLRYCGNGGDCDACCHPNPGEHREFEWSCLGPLLIHTASQIERDLKEIDELRKEVEWKDMVIALAQRKQAEAEAERDALLEIAKNGKDCDTCKSGAVCAQPGKDVVLWCDRCMKKCPCHGCRGNHWEWRGLPEAPEEGAKA